MSATGNLIEGNLIGTDKTGTIALGNAGEGIVITYAVSDTIGGTAAGAGNVISANAIGVWITDEASDILVQGNRIGTDITGTAALGNILYGVDISGSYIAGSTGNTIGGTAAGSGNVISANDGDGVYDIDSNGNLIASNWIGTIAGGTAALANTGDGVYVGGSSFVTVGGTAVGAGNMISGNDANGIEINDSTGTPRPGRT